MVRAAGGLACSAAFAAFLLATLGMDGSLHYPLSYSQVLIAGIAVLFALSARRDRRDANATAAVHPEAVRTDAIGDAPGGIVLTLASAALCVAYAAAWQVLGFFPSTFLYVVAQLWLLRQRGLLVLLGVPAGVVVLLYVVFDRLLALPFPRGMLLQQ